MTLKFVGITNPRDDVIKAVHDLSPRSPFNSVSYAKTLTVRRATPCALVLIEDQRIIAGCMSALSGRRWFRRLEIMTVPDLPEQSVFWQGIMQFCKEQKVLDVALRTFASVKASVPPLDQRILFRDRVEYVLDLNNFPDGPRISGNHKRNIEKGKRRGLQVTRSHETASYRKHVSLMQCSMMRRQERGENVDIPTFQDFDNALVQNGLGTIYIAHNNSETLASFMALNSDSSCYYHSAGNTLTGMRVGASPFLIYTVAGYLRDDNYSWFNLGGAGLEAHGLRRFKSGFGAEEIRLFEADYSMISPWRRKIINLAREAKGVPAKISRVMSK